MKTKITHSTSCLSIAALALIGTGATQAALVTFTPTNGDTGAFSGSTTLYDTVGTTTSTITSPTGSYLRFETNLVSTGNANFSHDVIGATITPSSQLVTLIDVTMDVREPSSGAGQDADTPLFFGIRQGGNTYYYSDDGSVAFGFRNPDNSSTVTIFANGLVATDFDLFAGTDFSNVTNGSNPDFSASGGEMQFLMGTGAATGGGTLDRVTDMINFEIDVTYTVVPEPSSAALLGLGGLALILRKRR